MMFLQKLKKQEYNNDVLRAALMCRGEEQQSLFSLAQERRQTCFPDNRPQVRSVIEVSNICRQKCKYCIIGADDQKVNFTLKRAQIIMLMEFLYGKGRRTILLQSGENLNSEFIDDVAQAIADVKQRHPDLRVILCMGDLSREDYLKLYHAGATDYILKFETSHPAHFSFCKPNDSLEHRLECIHTLAGIGYRVGSGNIVGLPGQTIDYLVDDLQLIHSLPLAMNSTTIFIPAEKSAFEAEAPGDGNTTLNFMALMRIMNPSRLMPTTSSLEKMIPDGQYLGLMSGANTVTIHDGTPEELQPYFPIYSVKRIRPQTNHFADILQRAGMDPSEIV